jgi:TetR/AcrR family transcriptional repressor of mexJK operon
MPATRRRSLARTTDLRGKRRDILDGAKRVFLRHGFIGAGVSKIAAEAHVSKRTLYQYFRSKEELFAEIIREVSKRIDAPIAPASIDGHKPRATLRQLAQVTAEITVLGDGPAFYRMISAETPRFPQLGRIFLEQAYELNAAHLASYFAQWNAAGELHVANPKFAADLFFGMINSIRFRVLLGAAASVTGAELERWLDFVVDVFLNGVERAPATVPARRQRTR